MTEPAPAGGAGPTAFTDDEEEPAESRCAGISADRGEPLWATASIVRAWVLVEQPGAWGVDAVAESRFPGDVARALEGRAERHGVRVLVLRRPERARTGPRHCFVAYSGRPSPWVEHRVLDDPHELLALDIEALAGGRLSNFGDPWPDPLYLVCTNGRHDPCCARLGRPVIRALLPERPEDMVWECSHIGGDRFAGNLVCYPHGLYFGRLGPAEATAVVAAYEAGRIELDHYRGRAGDPYPVQAAEYFLRRDQSLLGVEDVVPVDRRRLVGGTAADPPGDPPVIEVSFATADGRRFDVRVAVGSADPRPLTCASTRERRPPLYELVGVFPRGGTGSAVH